MDDAPRNDVFEISSSRSSRIITGTFMTGSSGSRAHVPSLVHEHSARPFQWLAMGDGGLQSPEIARSTAEGSTRQR